MALESFLNNRTSQPEKKIYYSEQGLLAQDKSNLELSEKNLTQLLADPDKKEIIFDIIREKASYLFAMFQYDLGEEGFIEFLNNTLEENRFKESEVAEIVSDLKNQFNINYGPSFDIWYDSKQLPGYLIGEVEAYSIIDGDRTRYQVLFNISNIEPVEGLVKVSFRMGGGGKEKGGASNDSDVEKIIRLGANQTKVIGIVLDEVPRVMTTNTMISKNLPAQLTFRFEKLEMNLKAKPIEGERIFDQFLALTTSNEIVVDNEDPGFEYSKPDAASYLKRVLNIANEDEEKYIPVWYWRPPTRWRATTSTSFYGKLIRSAFHIKAGTGDKKVAWNVNIPSGGRYEIYFHFSDNQSFYKKLGPYFSGGKPRKPSEYNFIIHHDDGPEEIILDLKNAEMGWNLLGSYYISEGETKVELTDESNARIVFADAVKWVKL